MQFTLTFKVEYRAHDLYILSLPSNCIIVSVPVNYTITCTDLLRHIDEMENNCTQKYCTEKLKY